MKALVQSTLKAELLSFLSLRKRMDDLNTPIFIFKEESKMKNCDFQLFFYFERVFAQAEIFAIQ